jgi:DNA repair protein RecO (recombination protein O)
MNQTYKATGINLKGMPLGETDRLVTILTAEFGLINAIAPGARKYKSRLRGRSELFVINELLIVKGRSLDKIIQADTIYTYPGLSQELGKLTAAQYLAELVLSLALSEQSQIELYELLKEHLRRIEQLNNQLSIYAYLAQAVFHFLALAGIAPQVYTCCLTQKVLLPNFDCSNWQVGFSFLSGGIVDLSTLNLPQQNSLNKSSNTNIVFQKTRSNNYFTNLINYKINGLELNIIQNLSGEILPSLELIHHPNFSVDSLNLAWIRIERILREYAEYHLGSSIRSASLIDELYLVEF